MKSLLGLRSIQCYRVGAVYRNRDWSSYGFVVATVSRAGVAESGGWSAIRGKPGGVGEAKWVADSRSGLRMVRVIVGRLETSSS